jgi:hypothetical protein
MVMVNQSSKIHRPLRDRLLPCFFLKAGVREVRVEDWEVRYVSQNSRGCLGESLARVMDNDALGDTYTWTPIRVVGLGEPAPAD